MRLRTICLLAGVVLLVAPAVAGAQEMQILPPSTITSAGVGTVEIAPDRAEFWLYFELTDTSLGDAAAEVKNTEIRILNMLKDREISPLERLITAPSIPDANTTLVTFALRLRFTIGRLAAGVDDPVVRLAEISDALRSVANDTEALLTGPLLTVSNQTEVERRAIMRAMENALPHAEAAAQSMAARIDTILDLRIVEVVWNQVPEYGADQPDSERTACTAKVEVVYVLE